jgi:tRNA (guanine-N7-)-methyltransferase
MNIMSPARHFYGRRKGHPLSALQQARMDELLPRLRPDVSKQAPQPLTDLFDAATREVWLEIGFGAGEHLEWQANHNPDVGIIGAEPFINGMAQLLTRVDSAGLKNVRLFDDEAQILLDWLPPASIARAFILFPDPWPKRRHWKRRIVSPKTIAALARVMRPGAELRVATDIADYVRTTLLAITGNADFVWPALVPDDWRLRSPDWPPTRYEAKAVEANRQCYYFRFLRR